MQQDFLLMQKLLKNHNHQVHNSLNLRLKEFQQKKKIKHLLLDIEIGNQEIIINQSINLK